MKRLIVAVCLAMLASPYGFAQEKAKDAEKKAAPAVEKSQKKEPSEKQKAQQDRMRDCQAKAGERKGDERKQFMSGCLKGETPAATPDKKATQQDKMKACNKDAGEKKLKGDDRKKFMSECLKG